MPRADNNDLCEIFGYAPDDTSDAARKQWKSQLCPSVGLTCIKHSHPQNGEMVVYGSCSVVNRISNQMKEEVVICPQRLYANKYESLRSCIEDAIGRALPIYLANEYSELKKEHSLPDDYFVILGRNSGKEITVTNPGVISLSLDWVMVRVLNNNPVLILPCARKAKFAL